jgi:hypothetical protein
MSREIIIRMRDDLDSSLDADETIEDLTIDGVRVVRSTDSSPTHTTRLKQRERSPSPSRWRRPSTPTIRPRCNAEICRERLRLRMFADMRTAT